MKLPGWPAHCAFTLIEVAKAPPPFEEPELEPELPLLEGCGAGVLSTMVVLLDRLVTWKPSAPRYETETMAEPFETADNMPFAVMEALLLLAFHEKSEGEVSELAISTPWLS
ncbi:Uncharacterised protein [uncultured archaeon]|nr:Uncharacterised protein [uncultured archaeon]